MAQSPNDQTDDNENDQAYTAHRDRAARRAAAQSASARDIGPIPPPRDPDRRGSAAQDLRLFCETYYPASFTIKWSAAHLRAIERLEQSILTGGLFAFAMPRGSGKTTLCEAAATWATLYGHREFVAIIGSDESAALEVMESIKTELESNDLIGDDFPEVCYPIERLEGIANRCAGQTSQGRPTKIEWTKQTLIYPTIEGAASSGAIIRVAGITGRVRGMKHKREDGRAVRPSLVLVDDPQTDQSARSVSLTEQRVRIIGGAILGLAGPKVKIAGVMPCTVIRAGDLADQFLDGEKHPEWQGERTRMMDAMPSESKMWEEYAIIRAEELRAKRGIAKATEFYAANREAMDAGAVPTWPERYLDDEISAIQHAMNIYITDPRAFQAEFQNEPLPTTTGDVDELSVDEIMARINHRPRLDVPMDAEHLTAFIDIQGALLYYVIVATSPKFDSWVIDYGAFPDQNLLYFTLDNAPRTLASVSKATSIEGRIFDGLHQLTKMILRTTFHREDGTKLEVSKCLVDANWGTSTDTVYRYCAEAGVGDRIMPSHGRYVGAATEPFAAHKRKPGERVGLNWRVPTISGKRQARHVTWDTNFWKSFTVARLQTMAGDPGSMTIFGNRGAEHRMIAEHITAEYRVRTTGRGREVDEWKKIPGRDNHLFDCVVGAMVAASMCGAAMPEYTTTQRPGESVVSFAEMWKAAQS